MCYYPSRSPKVNDLYVIWKPVCYFLLAINSNRGSILHRLATVHPWWKDEQTDERTTTHANSSTLTKVRSAKKIQVRCRLIHYYSTCQPLDYIADMPCSNNFLVTISFGVVFLNSYIHSNVTSLPFPSHTSTAPPPISALITADNTCGAGKTSSGTTYGVHVLLMLIVQLKPNFQHHVLQCNVPFRTVMQRKHEWKKVCKHFSAAYFFAVCAAMTC